MLTELLIYPCLHMYRVTPIYQKLENTSNQITDLLVCSGDFRHKGNSDLLQAIDEFAAEDSFKAAQDSLKVISKKPRLTVLS